MTLSVDDTPALKRAEIVARQIEADVSALGWPVGEVIGAEPELLERYGVSRAVLREAVRLVEHSRVARMRRGPGGGLVVEAPPAAVAAEAIAAYFGFADLTVDEIVEARASIEAMTAALAAERITEAGIDRLRELIDGEQPGDVQDHPLHIAVAELTGNAALVIFVAALSRTAGRWAGLGEHTGLRGKAGAEVCHAHKAIAEAIIAGDSARAQQRMVVHLEAGGAWMRKASKRPRGDEDGAGSRLAARVAEAIKDDVRVRSGAPGIAIASEAELIERHGVSRAVLREAIRILEHNGVAAMRRGPGGGLVAGESDPRRVLDVVGTYLRYAGVDRNVIFDARCSVELAAVELAAVHLDDAGAQRLQGILELERALQDDVVDAIGDLHVVLAELSGNRALAFFAGTLTRLTAQLVPAAAEYPPSARTAVHRAHGLIVDAVLAGDASLSRHRMLRHLEALSPFVSRGARR